MKNFKHFIFALFATLAFVSCEEEISAPETNYVTFADSNYSAVIDPGSTATVNITVYTATVIGNDRTFNLSFDGSAAPTGSFTVPATVVVPGGTNEGKFSVELSDPQNILTNYVEIQLVPENGLSVGKATKIAFVQSCNEVAVTLDFNLDYYSDETTWEILDAVGDVVISGGPYDRGSWVATENFNLCQGRDYTLVVYDAWSDGMNDGTNLGNYTLSIGGTVLVQEDGSFGASQSSAFSTN